jgi:hypothetical protein
MALINPLTSVATNGTTPPSTSSLIGFNNNGVAQQVSPGQGTSLPTQDQTLQGAQSTDNPIKVSITGDESGDFAGVNILEQVVTDGTGLAINTRTLNPPKLDANNAAVPSDAPPSAILYLGVNSPQTIDTTGYQTVVFQQTGAVSITVNHSNDGVNFQPVFGIPLTAATNTYVGTTAATAQLVYAFPVAAKFMRFSAATQTSVIVYLRQTPFASYAGLGTAAVTVSSGAVTVSGTVVVGSTATAAPVPLGGADYNNNTRRIQTDTNGNTQVVGQLPVGYQTGIYNVTYGGATQSTNPITATLSSVNPVMIGGTDNTGAARRIQTDMFGIPIVRGAPSTPATQSLEELLTQILGTLRVLTHYTYEAQLRDGFRSAADEPDIMLADYLNPASTLFNMTN